MASDNEKQFEEVLSHFDNAMLVSHNEAGRIHARPMAIASADPRDLWFVTGSESGKVRELDVDPRAAIICQGDGRYLSITGEAELIDDRGKIADLWKEAWRVWFPDGPADSRIVLIHVKPYEAEYWDRHGFLKTASYALRAARAYVKGERMDPSAEPGPGHGRVNLS